MDNLAKSQRSYCMGRIKSSDTKPELKYKAKYRRIIHQPLIFGSPDFINYKKRTVIFIDGCFWHKCPKHFIAPKSNKKYWLQKLERNSFRDMEVNLAYKHSGWKIVRIWEHELRN